jgi:hypothetical protein
LRSWGPGGDEPLPYEGRIVFVGAGFIPARCFVFVV